MNRISLPFPTDNLLAGQSRHSSDDGSKHSNSSSTHSQKPSKTATASNNNNNTINNNNNNNNNFNTTSATAAAAFVPTEPTMESIAASKILGLSRNLPQNLAPTSSLFGPPQPYSGFLSSALQQRLNEETLYNSNSNTNALSLLDQELKLRENERRLQESYLYLSELSSIKQALVEKKNKEDDMLLAAILSRERQAAATAQQVQNEYFELSGAKFSLGGNNNNNNFLSQFTLGNNNNSNNVNNNTLSLFGVTGMAATSRINALAGVDPSLLLQLQDYKAMKEYQQLYSGETGENLKRKALINLAESKQQEPAGKKTRLGPGNSFPLPSTAAGKDVIKFNLGSYKKLWQSITSKKSTGKTRLAGGEIFRIHLQRSAVPILSTSDNNTNKSTNNNNNSTNKKPRITNSVKMITKSAKRPYLA